MIWEHVRQKDWDEFQRRWPDAVSFLLRSDLMGELCHLESISRIKGWPERNNFRMDRLLELRGWYAAIAAIQTAHEGPLPCPICGEKVTINRETAVDGRLIASCGDAFSWQKWEEE